jgi:hypothetical protein
MTTSADVEVFVNAHLWSYIEKQDVAIVNGLPGRLTTKLSLLLSGTRLPEDNALAKLLKATVRVRSEKAPIMLLSNVNGVRYLTVRVPRITKDDESSMKNLAVLLKMAMAFLNLPLSQLRVREDPSLGVAVTPPAQVNKLVGTLTEAAKDARGAFHGEVYSTVTGAKGNLPELIAAMRLLNTKEGYVRKAPPTVHTTNSGRTETKRPNVTYQDVWSVVRKKANLEREAYDASFIGALITLTTSVRSEYFPGGFTYALRNRNSVKSNDGLLNRFGYVAIVPDFGRTKEVLNHAVRPKTNVASPSEASSVEMFTITKQTMPRGVGLRDFRAALSLTLPKYDPASTDEMEVQMKQGGLHAVKPQTLKVFSERADFVNELYRAYATKVSVAAPKSAAKPVHFQIARNTVLNHALVQEGKNKGNVLPLIDGAGNTYAAIDDIPKDFLRYVAKTFNYQLDVKRKAPENREPDVEPKGPVKVPRIDPPTDQDIVLEAQASEGGEITDEERQKSHLIDDLKAAGLKIDDEISLANDFNVREIIQYGEARMGGASHTEARGLIEASWDLGSERDDDRSDVGMESL